MSDEGKIYSLIILKLSTTFRIEKEMQISPQYFLSSIAKPMRHLTCFDFNTKYQSGNCTLKSSW